MKSPELLVVARNLSHYGYAHTNYGELGVEFDDAKAIEISAAAPHEPFSDAAAELTDRIKKKEMLIVQNKRLLEVAGELVRPVVEVLFEDQSEALDSWSVYAINHYEEGGELGIHKDSVSKTVVVVSITGTRVIDVYNKDVAEDEVNCDPETTFELTPGSVMILDAIADPAHSVTCTEGPSVSAVLDVPALIR